MMKFQRWRQRKQLARGLRAAAEQQLAAGEADQHQYDKLIQASNDNRALDRTLSQLKVNEDALGAIDWGRIVDWIIANWPTILRIILTVVMLLEPQDEE